MALEQSAGPSAQEKVAIFIDGASLYATIRTLGFDVDYGRLLPAFQNGGRLVRAFFYTAVIENSEQFSSLRPLVDWLEYNGYSIATRTVKEAVDAGGKRKPKGNMGVDLAVDAMEIAPRVGQMILFSGDGDLRPLVKAVQRRGVRVTVVSSVATQPAMIADDLRRQADEFIDLHDLRSSIARKVRTDIQVQRVVRRDGVQNGLRRRTIENLPTRSLGAQTPDE